MCGWLKDRYGLSWQVIPKRFMQMMDDTDPEKVKRATDAMLEMKKLDIAALEKAYASE
jgi:predicted 3-demethylubiquinone-9 3-methyltransferase (glyoxalase superfamily)